MQKSSGFKFWPCVISMCHLRMAVMRLPTKFCANSSIQFGVIDIFRNPRWRPPPSWILNLCEFGHSGVFVFCTKFGSNICYSHWDRRTYASDLYLMTSRELTSAFSFWSCVIAAWPWCVCPPNFAQIALSISELLTFFEIQDFQVM